ncbi:enoyl-CoA hydratase/isomerase family protein [Streptomyces sp. NBC_01231]|nr:enoyl-CoA hydratase/isomerase family protein [Streptomyces sp. NBC_01231]
MRTEPDRTELAGDLGLLVRLDTGSPLPELTAALDEVGEQAGKQCEPAAVVLRLTSPTHRPQAWPDGVTVQEVKRWERAVRRLEQLENTTVAVAEGTCGGAALDLLLAVDYRIGRPGLRLLLPVNDGHFWPGMSLYRLVRHIGPARARRIVLWDSVIELSDAAALGIVDQVAEDLAEAVRTATARRGRLSDRETPIRRRLLEEAVSAAYEDALGVHLAACDRELRRLAAGAQDDPGRTEPAG